MPSVTPRGGTPSINTAEAAYNHYINHGYAENRPGAPDSSEMKLEKALADVAAAAEANAEALKAAALLENANSATPLTGAALDSFIEGYTATNVAVELANANADVALAVSNLASARATKSDAALKKEAADALADVLADSIARGLYNTRETARAELNADVAANGTDLEVLTALRDALLSAVTNGLSTSTQVDSGPVTVAELIDDLNAEIAAPTAATSAALITTIAGYDALPNLDDTAAEDPLEVVVDRDALNTAFDNAENAVATDGSYGAVLAAAEAALEARDDLIKAVADAQDYLAEYQAAADAVESAQDALDAATEALEDLGYNAPVELGASFTGTDGGDILIYKDLDTGLLTSTVTGFGADGDDMIFFGKDFVRVDLAPSDNFTAGGKGSAGALEIFVKQVGANTILYVEDDSFDGSVGSGFDGNVITLVGVDASSLQFENGILRIVDSVA